MTGLAVDPPSISCVGCTRAGAKIRALLNHISTSFSKNPSKFLGFDLPDSDPLDCSELFCRWAQQFDSDPKFPLCPDLKRRIEALVYNLINETASNCQKRKHDEGLLDIMSLLKRVAVDPCDDTGADREWKDKVLKARKALFVRVADVSNREEFPYLKKQRTHKFLSATNSGGLNPHRGFNDSLRRSQRTLLKLGNSELPRKRIPIGPTFQANVPEWTPTTKTESYDSRWLGTKIWSIEGHDRKNIDDETIGKGKPYTCDCSHQGSEICIKSHVSAARLRLKSELGPAFYSLGFDEMGEDFSKSWTQKEQMRFDELLRQNPLSEGKSFLGPALEYFESKSRRDIVSFYFNVFLLRWMGIRTRLGARTVDSSDDEGLGWG